jgi:hypothetical protein
MNHEAESRLSSQRSLQMRGRGNGATSFTLHDYAHIMSGSQVRTRHQ